MEHETIDIVAELETHDVWVEFDDVNQAYFFYRKEDDDDVIGDGYLYEEFDDAAYAAAAFYGII